MYICAVNQVVDISSVVELSSVANSDISIKDKLPDNTAAEKAEFRRRFIRALFGKQSDQRTFTMKQSQMNVDGFKRTYGSDNLIQMVQPIRIEQDQTIDDVVADVIETFDDESPVYVPLESGEAVKLNLQSISKEIVMQQVDSDTLQVTIGGYPTPPHNLQDGETFIHDGVYVSYGSGIVETVTEGCMDSAAFNYNPDANDDPDNTCVAVVEGCTNSNACNYNALANTDDGSCDVPDASACETCAGGESQVTNDADSDGICDADEVVGCQDDTACNYNAAATDAGSCEFANADNCESCSNGAVLQATLINCQTCESGVILDNDDDSDLVCNADDQCSDITDSDALNSNGIANEACKFNYKCDNGQEDDSGTAASNNVQKCISCDATFWFNDDSCQSHTLCGTGEGAAGNTDGSTPYSVESDYDTDCQPCAAEDLQYSTETDTSACEDHSGCLTTQFYQHDPDSNNVCNDCPLNAVAGDSDNHFVGVCTCTNGYTSVGNECECSADRHVVDGICVAKTFSCHDSTYDNYNLDGSHNDQSLCECDADRKREGDACIDKTVGCHTAEACNTDDTTDLHDDSLCDIPDASACETCVEGASQVTEDSDGDGVCNTEDECSITSANNYDGSTDNVECLYDCNCAHGQKAQDCTAPGQVKCTECVSGSYINTAESNDCQTHLKCPAGEGMVGHGVSLDDYTPGGYHPGNDLKVICEVCSDGADPTWSGNNDHNSCYNHVDCQSDEERFVYNQNAQGSCIACGDGAHAPGDAFRTDCVCKDGYQDLSADGCILTVHGCTNPAASNYNAGAHVDDNSCTIPGCTDASADEGYDENANVDDGSCIYNGCTDSSAFNYDSSCLLYTSPSPRDRG